MQVKQAIFFLGVTLALLPRAASAQTWVTYDNFNHTFSPLRWSVQRNTTTATTLDERREIVAKSLHLDAATYGSPTSLSADIVAPAAVNQIRAVVGLSLESRSVTCPTSGYGTAYSHAGVGGRFFRNAGMGQDVGAYALLRQGSDGTFSALGVVRYCADDQCASGTQISSVSLGTINRRAARLSVRWDSALQRFEFQRDSEAVVTASVSGLNSGTPTLNRKALQIWNDLPSCPSGQQSASLINARFDAVETN